MGLCLSVWRSTITNQSQLINSGSIRHKNNFFSLFSVLQPKGDVIYPELSYRHLEQSEICQCPLSLLHVLQLRHTARSAITRETLVQIGYNAVDE
jgi:hypothetical protein